jgi:hypothetical protein
MAAAIQLRTFIFQSHICFCEKSEEIILLLNLAANYLFLQYLQYFTFVNKNEFQNCP